MKSAVRKVVLYVLSLTLISGVGLVQARRLAHADDVQAPGPTVTIDNFSFTPKEITVVVGTTVTWVNHDDVPHTVVSSERKFRSNALDTGDRFSFTFREAGTYGYFCSVHPMMTGRVVVH
jgi:plastocyanin